MLLKIYKEEYIDNIKHLIEQKDADKVKGLLIDLHPEMCIRDSNGPFAGNRVVA